MKWFRRFLGLMCFSPIVVWADFGLLAGDLFIANNLIGRPTVLCPDPNNPGFISERRTIFCNYTLLRPVEQSRFYTTSGINADTLVLSSLSSNGEISTLITDFDSVTGQSKQELNLWSWLLLRRPLLRLGENNRHYLAYDLYLGRELVEQGNFLVTVTMGPTIYCPIKVITLDDPTDCYHTKYVCLRYFRDSNFCQ